MHEITKEILQEIKDTASKLPIIPQTRKLPNNEGVVPIYYSRRVHGSSVLKVDSKATYQNKDGDKRGVKSNEFYSMQTQEFLPVDHFKKLKEAYMTKGYEGFLNYCTWVRDQFKFWEEWKLKNPVK